MLLVHGLVCYALGREKGLIQARKLKEYIIHVYRFKLFEDSIEWVPINCLSTTSALDFFLDSMPLIMLPPLNTLILWQQLEDDQCPVVSPVY